VTPRDWRGLVARHAESTGIDLSPQTMDELAAHLEDIYLSARADGHPDSAARQQANKALEASGLLPLRREPRLDSRRPYRGLAQDVAAASRHRSLALFYALRMAFRQLRLHPAFSLVAVLVLGLGTGSAAVVYTIVDTVVLRALPYERPDRLVKLWDANLERGVVRDPFSPVTFMDYRALSSFKDAAAWWRPEVNLVDPGLEPVRVKTIETSSNLFRLLGVSPEVGPGFLREDALHNPELQAVISDRLWKTRYRADAGLIGRQLSLNGAQYTIVGVMPPGFRFPDDVDVWERLSWDLSEHSRHAHFMEGVARLADAATVEQASADVRALAARLGTEFAASNKGWAFEVVPLLEDQLGYYRPALYVLFGAVGLLLVIGCLNVASLLLTRALTREREMAVRTAVGAAPRQIVSQLVGESLMLSLAGAFVGLVIAFAALPLVVACVPVEVPRLANAAINGRVLALALGLVVAMTVVFGLVPALVLLRRQIGTDLRSGDRGSSRGVRRFYQGLVVAEVALACALLVSSVLLVRTVRRMMQVPLGVDGGSSVVASVQLTLESGDLAGFVKVGSLHSQILERLREQPGIVSAGSTNRLPIENGWRGPLARPDQITANSNDLPQAQHISVSEGYFETLGARLVEGRFFGDRDAPGAEAVVILNQTAARRYFGAESAIGRELRSWSSQMGPLGRNLTWRELEGGHRAQPALRVVGVVADIQNVALGLPVEPAAYFPTRQFPFAAVTLAINARDTATAVAALKAALQQVSPQTPIGVVETWSDRLATRTAEPRLLMSTLSAFGALAAFLAALGVYGLFSWSVALRRRELAIRLTLGARPAVVASSVIGQSVTLVAVGLLAGFALVQGARHLLASVLFGVEPHDPVSTLVAGGFLLLAALIASVPPAWQAMRVDPVDGLRVE
jgi:putative ABC transport system permease protein